MWFLFLLFSFHKVFSWTTSTSAVHYTRTIINRECPAHNKDKWRGRYFCDPGYFAVGLRYWYEESTTDDTAGNDARLYCAPLYNWGTNFAGNNPIPSNSPNKYGHKNQARFCPPGQFMNGFKTKDSGSDCTEGVTNIMINCQYAGLLSEFTGNKILNHGGYNSVTAMCPAGEYVCGLELRYMDYAGIFVADRSMSALRLQCCSYVMCIYVNMCYY